MPSSSNVDSCIHSSSSVQPSVENSVDRILYNDQKPGFESVLITVRLLLSISVTFSPDVRSLKNFRNSRADSGSVANLGGRQPPRKQYLSSSAHSWRTLYSELLEMTFLRFSNIKYDRSLIASSAFGYRSLAVSSTLPGSRRGYSSLKSVASCSSDASHLIATIRPVAVTTQRLTIATVVT